MICLHYNIFLTSCVLRYKVPQVLELCITGMIRVCVIFLVYMYKHGENDSSIEYSYIFKRIVENVPGRWEQACLNTHGARYH